MIYVGNQGGIMEYDGVSWRVVMIPNMVVRSMAMDNAGNFYIGGSGEIGMFSPPRTRDTRRYSSLNDRTAGTLPDFSVVYAAHWTPQGAYFNTLKYLFRWNPGSKRFNHWKTIEKFHLSFECGGVLYIRQVNTGLMVMKNDQLELVPGGEIFADKKIYMMAPFPVSGQNRASPGKILIGTRSNGFYIYDGRDIRPFNVSPPARVYLDKNLLYHGISLLHSPRLFALATLRGGLAIMDEKGTLVDVFDTSTGLLDNTVFHVFEDRGGNLWLGLSKGIAKIEYSSPISFFNQRNGLTGLVLSVVRHPVSGRLYAGTSNGLYTYLPRTGGRGTFQPIPGVPGYCYCLLPTGDSLLTASMSGVFQVDDRNSARNADRNAEVPVRQITATPSQSLVRSRLNPRRTWAGTQNGLLALTVSAEGQWKKERAIDSVTEQIFTIVEEPDGHLWLGARSKGVISVAFPIPGSIEQTVVKRFHTSHGLPPGETDVAWAAGHLMVTTEKGIYRFEQKKQRFLPDSTLGKEFAGGSRRIFRLVPDSREHIWFHSKSRNYHAVPQPGGTYKIDSIPFQRMSLEQVNAIYPDQNGRFIWFARHDGLYAFDKTVKKNYSQPFSTLIREVVINGQTTFFDNKKYRYKPVPVNKKGTPTIPVVPYKERNLRFRFAAPFFEDQSALMFRYMLEGYDSGWSQWTNEAQKDYTNIDPGSHRFRVQARNVYGHFGNEAVYPFTVLPPWYRTWWAYTIYAVLFVLVFYLTGKWRTLKHRREKQALEQQVIERTEEVREKNKQLEEMAKVKSRFFANISHEFRTPLTLIMGPLEQITDETTDPGKKQQFGSMLDNTRRLLGLINQLLELSKFESGTMKLLASHRDVVSFLQGIVSSFKMAAQQKQIDLIFNSEPAEIQLYFDGEKLDKIIGNLLSNAVKFTPPGGSIAVEAAVKESDREDCPGHLVISVKDTGPGIPQDQIPHIFDRFFQAPRTRTYEGSQKGSGIGLALVKELVTLHYGDIEVRSPGQGTEFVLGLPLGKNHFKPDQIVDLPETFPESPRHEGSYVIHPGPAESIDIKTGTAGAGEEPQRPVILVVEDNREMRRFIIESLHDQFEVAQAADGKEGIDKAGEIIPDLIVSDIMMPRADGYELCRTLKKERNTSHIPIILLTAKASDENIIEGLESGADDYITKPFNAKILYTRVKNLIKLRRRLHERIENDMVLQPAEIKVSSVDESFLKELRDIIEKNMSDSLFGVERLAKKLYMSRVTLYRKLMALTGQSPNQFIRSYRLKRAAQLFDADFGNVSQVALEVGFTNFAHFSKCFKEAFHQLPSAYYASRAG